MKKQIFSTLTFLAFIIALMTVLVVIWDKQTNVETVKKDIKDIRDVPNIDHLNNMKVSSSEFENEGKIPSRFTCDGGEISIPLEIDNVPEGAKSLALIMNDNDDEQKKDEGGREHWVKWNIPPDTRIIEEGKNPPSITEEGQKEGLFYQGPCPSFREHRYSIKVYALDKVLDILGGSTKKDLQIAMLGHIIGDGELIGIYSRN